MWPPFRTVLASAILLMGCGPSPEELKQAAVALALEHQDTAIVQPARPHGERDGATVYRKQVLSPVHTIDRLYRSMEGPMTTQRFMLGESETPELLWVTGYGAVMTAPDGDEELSNQFMCHSNLEMNPERHHKQFPSQLVFTDGRLFTLAQGQLKFELPEGFGIPMSSNQTLSLDTQVLNHNVVGQTIGVRHRVTLDFVRDADLKQPLQPLIQRGIFGLTLVEGRDGHFGLKDDEVMTARHGPGCLPGLDASKDDNPHVISDGEGREFSGFWVVPPGRQENRTRVTELLKLPYDTTVHAIAVHLHPFAESAALIDRSTHETIFESRTRQADEGIGLKMVESFSSAEGIPLYRNHEYELVSVYNNTSGVDQDSMAVMYLYLLAKDIDTSRLRARL